MLVEMQILFSINLGLFLLGLVMVFKRAGSILNIYGIMYIIGLMMSSTLFSLTIFSATLVILLTEVYQGVAPVFAFFSGALVVFFAIVFWKWWSMDSAVNKVKVIIEGF